MDLFIEWMTWYLENIWDHKMEVVLGALMVIPATIIIMRVIDPR